MILTFCGLVFLLFGVVQNGVTVLGLLIVTFWG